MNLHTIRVDDARTQVRLGVPDLERATPQEIEPGVDVGPLIDQAAIEKVESMVP